MQSLQAWMNSLNGIVWGPAMLVLILGTGLYLQVRLGGMPILRIGSGLRLVWRGRVGDVDGHGEVSPFAALMTCLAATIGVGNIAGVATAIALGGPGAVFWMWMTALVGMATKYAEVVLAVHYRENDADGRWVGGPMYAIRKGLGAAGRGSARRSRCSAGSRVSASATWCRRTASRPRCSPRSASARR